MQTSKGVCLSSYVSLIGCGRNVASWAMLVRLLLGEYQFLPHLAEKACKGSQASGQKKHLYVHITSTNSERSDPGSVTMS